MSKDSCRKRSYYSGPLAKPIPWEQPLPELAEPPPLGCNPRIADIHNAVRVEISRHNACQFRQGLMARLQKLMLLCEHFDIRTDPLPPGWSLELAVALARRHESLFTRGGETKILRIFAAYGIDPDQSEAHTILALELAQKHVPGMSYGQPNRAKSRLDTVQLASLFMAVVLIEQHLKQVGERVSDRQVAAILADHSKLASIIPCPAADAIANMLKTTGNNDRGNPSPLSIEALRGYLEQMRNAWKAVGEGNATALQVRFVEEVMPLFTRQHDEEGWVDLTG